MSNQSADLLAARLGKMSLVTLIHNLSETKVSSISEITYDNEGRYVELTHDDIFRKNFTEPSNGYTEKPGNDVLVQTGTLPSK